MKIQKILIAALAAGVCMSTATAADANKELRIGVEASYPPFEFKTPEGKITGFDVDVGNAICKELEVKCKWVAQPFDSLIAGLNARKFDMIHSGLTVTEARKKVVDFTTPLYAITSQLVAKKDSGIEASVESLKGKRVGVLQGSVQANYAREFWRKKGVKITMYQDQSQTFTDLRNGRLDAALIEKPNASVGFLSRPEGKGFGFVGKPFTDNADLNSEIAMALRQDSKELKTKVNQAIKTLQSNGTIEKISKKYFKDDEVRLIGSDSAEES